MNPPIFVAKLRVEGRRRATAFYRSLIDTTEDMTGTRMVRPAPPLARQWISSAFLGSGSNRTAIRTQGSSPAFGAWKRILDLRDISALPKP